MKIAISVPEPVFQAGEQVARKLKLSRSQLYSKALEEYIGEQRGRGVSPVTEALNRVYAKDTNVDPDIEAAAMETLARNEWNPPRRRRRRALRVGGKK